MVRCTEMSVYIFRGGLRCSGVRTCLYMFEGGAAVLRCTDISVYVFGGGCGAPVYGHICMSFWGEAV